MKPVLIGVIFLCCSLFLLLGTLMAESGCDAICNPIKIEQKTIADSIIALCESTTIGKSGFRNHETGNWINCQSIYQNTAELGAYLHADCLARCKKQ